MSVSLIRNCVHKIVPALRQQIRLMSAVTADKENAAPPAEIPAQGDQVLGRGISSRKIEVNGTSIHYDKAGHGRHLVLLLPGAMGSSRTDFSYQLENMNRDIFTLIAWDPRGYGLSRPPERTWPPHFLERDAEDALKLMDELPNMDESLLPLKTEENEGKYKYSLLGWSDGGITAMIMAAKRPESVRKLVVWGANSYITNEDVAMYEKVRNVDQWSESMRSRLINLYGEPYFRKHWDLWTDTFSAYLKNRSGDICKSELSKITCPTLVIHGQKDAMVPQEHAEYIANNIPNSNLHLMEDGKHNLHMKYYKEFNSMVEGFLLE